MPEAGFYRCQIFIRHIIEAQGYIRSVSNDFTIQLDRVAFSQHSPDYSYEPYVMGGEKTEAGRDRAIPIRPDFFIFRTFFGRAIPTVELIKAEKG